MTGSERAAAVLALERALDAWARGGRSPVADVPRDDLVHTVVLVEGASDRAALHAAAEVLGRRLAPDGTAVVPMGGAMSARRYVDALRAGGLRTALRGLCDAGEVRFFERAGLDAGDLAVCRPDLEGELLAALGVDRTEEVLHREGDLRLFRTFQNQPAQRGRPSTAQLHRFFGTTSGRKEKYGRLLVGALGPDELPAPLRAVIAGEASAI